MRVSTRADTIFVLSALALLIANTALSALAIRFFPDAMLLHAPVLSATALQIAAGLAFAGVAVSLLRGIHHHWLVVIVLGGLGLRLVYFGTNPVLETDFYRYLWDGALVLAGENPWRVVPLELVNGQSTARLLALAAEADPVPRLINHPELRSIYPPLAQLFFALAGAIKLYSIDAWRGVLLASDLVSLTLAMLLLRQRGLPLVWVGLWWLNPLVVRETVGTLHVDALLVPFLLAAMLLWHRRLLAGLCLACATAIKLWPVVLLLWLFRGPLGRRIGLAAAVGGALVGVCVAPMLLTGPQESAGLIAYSARWDTNGGVFNAVLAVFGTWLDEPVAQRVSRLSVVAVFGVTLLWLARKTPRSDSAPVDHMSLAVLALLLLSPAGYPWYFVPLMAFMVVRPRWSSIVLTLTLPLYYLRFHFGPRDAHWIYESAVLAVEFLPVIIVVLLELSGRLQPPEHRPRT